MSEISPGDRYAKLLTDFANSGEEELLMDAQEFGRDLLAMQTPPEEIGEYHQRGLDLLAKEFRGAALANSVNHTTPILTEVLMAYGLAFREQAQRREQNLKKLNQQLEQMVVERTVELERNNRELEQNIAERKQAQQHIQSLNVELEDKVKSRTRELEVSNKELEAFCYSVSHDLRAPLRSINGFSQVIVDDYADVLDDKGRDYLKRIMRNTQQMSTLIDDLLELSRVTRCNFKKQLVDLHSLAQESADKIVQSTALHRVNVYIAPTMMVQGDKNLLSIVMDNLFGNAYKYSSSSNPATIEFNTIDKDNKLVYYIRDNGVGFDKRYLNKLFKPFTRLHGLEFEGTGVGLATVQRIIDRHGGEIWADAKLGEGATFFFTLNGSNS